MNPIDRHLGILTFLLTLLIIQLACGIAQASQPNIVFILADDLGYADLGCYGSKVNRTPHLDRLAASGMRFTDFHSNGPMCSPTRAAFLTGLYQNRFGRRFEAALSGKNHDPGLPLQAVTIAEVLRDAGYATGCFGKWHLGYGPPYLPTNQGFDEYRGLLSGDGDYHTHVDRSGNEDWWHNHVLSGEEGYITDLVTRHGIEFIKRHREKPFFLYLPHLAVHFPWQGSDDPPHRKAGTSYHRDKWGIIPDRTNVRPHLTAMIESLDTSVGAIVATLEELNLTNRTLVFFTSDNGGYRTYQGGFKNISDMGPLRGQKTEVYEGGHRVGAIAYWPGKIEPSVCDDTTMTFDLFPTFAKLAGRKPGSWGDCDGVDLSALLFNRKPVNVRTLFWRIGAKKCVRDGRHKLCVLPNQPPALYDLATDLGETTNVASKHPQLVSRLRQSLSDWEQSVDRSALNWQSPKTR
jgi:arylsulfatase A-like enzyme